MEQNNTDVIVNQSELAQIEKEILAKDKQREDTLRKQIEEETRAKIEQENRLKELEENNKKLQELIVLNAKKQDEEKLAREQELLKIKEELAKPKGYVNTSSPFQQQKESNHFDANKLSPEQIREIDEESKKAFMKHLGMADVEWQ